MPIMSGAQSSPSAPVLITDELITIAWTLYFHIEASHFILLASDECVLYQAFAGENLTLKYCCVHKGWEMGLNTKVEGFKISNGNVFSSSQFNYKTLIKNS